MQPFFDRSHVREAVRKCEPSAARRCGNLTHSTAIRRSDHGAQVLRGPPAHLHLDAPSFDEPDCSPGPPPPSSPPGAGEPTDPDPCP